MLGVIWQAWYGWGGCFGNQGLKFNWPLSNTFSVETHEASNPGSVGKGSSRSYITLIYGGEREDGVRMETEPLGGGPRLGPLRNTSQ